MADDDLFINGTITKALHPIADDSRFFEGYLTVQVKDKQGEITVVDELIKVLLWPLKAEDSKNISANKVF